MSIVRISAAFVLAALAFNARAQQSPQYTQFMYNNAIFNPAYSGTDGVLSLTALTRSQWNGLDGAPSTQTFAAHTLLPERQVGLGLAIIRDAIGVHKNTNIRTNYAYHIPLKTGGVLSMGLQAGITTFKSDYASLLGNSNDPQLMNSVNKTLIGFGTGVYYRSERWCAGLSIPELMSKTINLQDTASMHVQRRNVLGYARYSFVLNESFDLQPAVLIKYFANVPVSADVNLNVVYRKVLTGGIAYRNKESIDLLMRFQLTQQLQFGYAYDHPIQVAGRLSGGSHELMIGYLFHTIQKDVASPR